MTENFMLYSIQKEVEEACLPSTHRGGAANEGDRGGELWGSLPTWGILIIAPQTQQGYFGLKLRKSKQQHYRDVVVHDMQPPYDLAIV